MKNYFENKNLFFTLGITICGALFLINHQLFSQLYEEYYSQYEQEYVDNPYEYYTETPWEEMPLEMPGFRLGSSNECLRSSLGPIKQGIKSKASGDDIVTQWESPIQPDPIYPGVTIESYFVPKREESPQQVAYVEEDESQVTSANDNNQNNSDQTAINNKPPYTLKIGDQLQISLYGFRDARTDRVVLVDPTGTISYLFVGTINALGKTIDEVRKEIEDKAKLQYPHVIATASALNLTGDTYTIMGEVNLPETRPITGSSSILSAIALAGGFPLRSFRNQTIDYADLDRSFLSRNGEYIPVDFTRLIRQGDLSQNTPLQGGDYIYIPSLTAKEIYVLGEFSRPFVYSYMQAASLAEVITWAGGLTSLASSRVAVIRGALTCPTTYLVDVNLIFNGCQPDFPLCPGDIVYAPPAKFGALKEIVRAAISIYVGALATQAGENSFFKLAPNARNFNNNNFFVNPALIPQQQPPTIIIGQ